MERATLVDWLKPRRGERILDAPAGGGYLAEGIGARIGTSEGIVCLEPSAKFADAIGVGFEQLRAPLDDPGVLAAGSYDAIGSLAGLHHLEDKRVVYRVWKNALRSGGRVALADVEVGTPTGEFLNGFVNEFTEGGHDGMFLEPVQIEEEFKELGFTDIRHQLVDVPWRFPSREVAGRFCHSLFDLRHTDAERVLGALEEVVGLRDCAGGVELCWQLRYLSAVS